MNRTCRLDYIRRLLPMLRKFVLFCIFCTVCGMLFAACDGDQAVSYAPDAYGENVHCYYVYDPAEVIALQQADLCPQSWTPLMMPLYWHSMYYTYYDSPSYYDHYIPVARRTYYRTTVVRQFETVHRTEITRYSSRGKWKGTDGKEYNGKTLTTQVKSGKSGFSSGSARQSTTKVQSKTTTQSKTTSQSKITTQSKTTTQPRISSGFRSGSARGGR